MAVVMALAVGLIQQLVSLWLGCGVNMGVICVRSFRVS
jgi:hypothetical protein